jgi:hypothetical protein
MKSIAIMINGFAAGWLMVRGGFTWGCVIAWLAIGISTIYLSTKNDK